MQRHEGTSQMHIAKGRSQSEKDEYCNSQSMTFWNWQKHKDGSARKIKRDSLPGTDVNISFPTFTSFFIVSAY